MPLCSFGSRSAMFDITPVENLFIDEYMRRAPGDFVKVYLYGLMDCYHGGGGNLEEFARALGMTQDEVRTAFGYWANMGLVEETAEGFCYHNLKHMLYNRPGGESLYRYQAFNQQLQQMFPQRMLQTQDYVMAYSWIEELGLPQEVVLLLVQFSLQSANNGEKVSFKYMDRIALDWVKQGIKTLDAAEQYLQQRELRRSDGLKVLKHLGINRLPTKDEQEFIQKWRGWGFALEGMLAACKEMTKIQQPNLNYLDKVLASYHRLALHEPLQIRRYQQDGEQLQGLVQQVAYAMGKREYTPEHEKLYTKWTAQWSFAQEAILMVAQGCRSFPALDRQLAEWQAQGCLTQAQLQDKLAQRSQGDDNIREVLARCKQSGGVTEAQRSLYARWTGEWQLPHELVLLAAEYATVADNKLAFLQRILESWRKAGINSVSAARADHDTRVAGRISGSASGRDAGMTKVVDAAKYTQREYSESDFDYLFENNPILKDSAQ